MGAFTNYTNSKIHHEAAGWAKDLYGIQQPQHGAIGAVSKATGMGKYLRFLGPAFLAYSAYEGYQQGGVGGAIGSIVSTTIETYAMGVAYSAVGGVTGVLGGMALGAGVAYAAGVRPHMLARPWVDEYAKKNARIEMATPIMDEYGTVATMRQRSMRAIQNSRVNGRTALGNEAALTYTPYWR